MVNSAMKAHIVHATRRLPIRHLALALCLAAMAFLSAACRQDMHDQPKYKPLRESPLFRDERSARPLVEGVVARGFLREDSEYYTGKVGQGQPSAAMGAAPAGAGATTGAATGAGAAPPPAAATGAQPPAAGAGEFAGFTTTFPFPIDRAALDRG